MNAAHAQPGLPASQRTRAVLFDLDGTLLDTAPDMVGALNQLRAEEGEESLPLAQVRPFVSHGARALVQIGFPLASDAVFEARRARFLDIYRTRLARETTVYEGVEQALTQLESAGILWGIVTNKPGWLTQPLLERLALHRRAAVVVSGDTLPQRKPHPAPLLHAAEKLAASPADCIYVGDAERDVLAARAAGMRVFVALFGYIPASERPREWPASGWLESPALMARWLASLRAEIGSR
jgi:N-acetyl-D-muramate 6-phosphate phosphatase